MFDIGIGELLLLAAVGLFVFGPEKLPRAAADAGKWLRQIRGMAANARQDLADSAGLDLSDTMDTVNQLRDLHPRRLAASMLSDDPAPKTASANGGPSKPAASKPADGASAAATPDFDPDAT